MSDFLQLLKGERETVEQEIKEKAGSLWEKIKKIDELIQIEENQGIRFCNVEGCNNKWYCKGFCHKHYREKEREIGIRNVCKIEGCNRTEKTKGLCDSHYMGEYRKRVASSVDLKSKPKKIEQEKPVCETEGCQYTSYKKRMCYDCYSKWADDLREDKLDEEVRQGLPIKEMEKSHFQP